MVRAENAYFVYGGSANMFVTKPELSEHSGQDFHLPFYFCGMLKRIVAYAKKAKVSLAEAAVQVQYADYGFLFPLDGNRPVQSNGGQVRIPDPPWRNFSIFVEGLKELRAYNPELRFWGEVDEKGWTWPDPARPVVKKVEKPKVKTDMTRKEAEYWLGVLRQTLCSVVDDNVKGVTLLGKDWRTSASASENHWVKLRERDFGSEDYFDRTAVTRLEVHGYLPIRKEKPKGRDRWMSFDGRHTCGEIHFESCMNVIRRFLSACFDLDADIRAIEIASAWYDFILLVRHKIRFPQACRNFNSLQSHPASEHWTIPVRQFERNLV